MHYLTFDLSDSGDGVSTLEAIASTAAAKHDEVMAEVQQVLGWAWRQFPHSHGALDEGLDWDHDLQVQMESGSWHTVTLTLTGSQRFTADFIAAFGHLLD